MQQSLRAILYTIQIEKEIDWDLIFGIMHFFISEEEQRDRYCTRSLYEPTA